MERARNLSKNVDNKANIERIQSILSEFDILFDVSCCKCPIQDGICNFPLEKNDTTA